MTKIIPKLKKLLKFPQNLQNDWNVLRNFDLMKIPLKHPKYAKPLFLVI